MTSVSLTCSSRHPDNPNDLTGSDSVSNSLQMTLTDDDDGITCSCTAVWKVASLYTLSDSITFTVYCESLHVFFFIFSILFYSKQIIIDLLLLSVKVAIEVVVGGGGGGGGGAAAAGGGGVIIMLMSRNRDWLNKLA